MNERSRRTRTHLLLYTVWCYSQHDGFLFGPPSNFYFLSSLALLAHSILYQVVQYCRCIFLQTNHARWLVNVTRWGDYRFEHITMESILHDLEQIIDVQILRLLEKIAHMPGGHLTFFCFATAFFNDRRPVCHRHADYCTMGRRNALAMQLRQSVVAVRKGSARSSRHSQIGPAYMAPSAGLVHQVLVDNRCRGSGSSREG